MKVNCYGTVRTHERDMPPDFVCDTLKFKKCDVRETWRKF